MPQFAIDYNKIQVFFMLHIILALRLMKVFLQIPNQIKYMPQVLQYLFFSINIHQTRHSQVTHAPS